MLKHVPWASHGEEKPETANSAAEEESSLTSILDAHQRSELTLLIANATALMRKTVESNFDATVSNPSKISISKHLCLGWWFPL